MGIYYFTKPLAYMTLAGLIFLFVLFVEVNLDWWKFMLCVVRVCPRTLKMLTGEILPSSGEASMNGLDILKHQTEVRRLIGYCPQHDALVCAAARQKIPLLVIGFVSAASLNSLMFMPCRSWIA